MPRLTVTVLTATVLGLMSSPTLSQSAEKKKRDVGKRKIESPVKHILAESGQERPAPAAAATKPRAATVGSARKGKDVLKQVVRFKDRGKGGIENPLKRTFARQPRGVGKSYFVANTAPKPTAKKSTATKSFVNPKVEPGKVRWHADFATAVAASKKSRKPVLLFQMIGRMDERFS